MNIVVSQSLTIEIMQIERYDSQLSTFMNVEHILLSAILL